MLTDLKKLYSWPAIKPDFERYVHGWLNESNKVTFQKHRNAKIETIIELGSWLGMSAMFLCDLFPKAQVICVDHWEGSLDIKEQHEDLLKNAYERFLVNCWDYRDQITPIRTDSRNGLDLVFKYGISPDLIYIDASHSYEDVYEDLLFSFNLFPEAIIIGDDWHFADVREAVNDFCEEYNKSVYVLENTWELVR